MRPERIGPYRIQATVAEDAFTITYRAEDPALGRTLLLKTGRASPPLAAVRERLSREARLVAPLAHPGLLTLHGLVRKDDAVFLLFEDAPGPRLAELLARTPALLAPRALAVAAGIAAAVGHMHARGLVHGGLRPEHVSLDPDGTVRIVDFSTARAAGAPAGRGAAAPADEEEEAPGPPEYLAPEQILSEGTTTRSDVFSLGVVLFQMLAGERPWADPPPRRPGPDALAPAPPAEPRHVLAHRIRSAPPPPLTTLASADPPGALATPAGHGAVARAPSALVERIVARCLAKDPADRYPDGDAVLEDLKDALEEASNEPAPALVVRALAAASYAPDLPPKAARRPAELSPERDVLRRLSGQLAAVLGLILLGAAVTEVAREGTRPAPPPSETPPGARGYLRVLARPWAEVIVDGETIDTTPMARPIAVAPGRHFVTFAHPNAPEEKRSVDVGAGQTVLIDVEMRVERPQRDAGADAAPIDDSP